MTKPILYRECEEIEKQCSKCLDWWPNDSEFYHADAKTPDGLTRWCKCCWSEYQHGRRAKVARG